MMVTFMVVHHTIMKKTTYTWFKYPEIQKYTQAIKQTAMLYLYFLS